MDHNDSVCMDGGVMCDIEKIKCYVKSHILESYTSMSKNNVMTQIK